MPVVPVYIVSAMLFLGAPPLPYGYYMLLRLVACGFFVWATIISYEKNNQYLPWAFGFPALLFNPIIKIHLPKELLTVTVPGKDADEIFGFIYDEAMIDRPHGGLMYMSNLECVSDYSLPEDLPEEE